MSPPGWHSVHCVYNTQYLKRKQEKNRKNDRHGRRKYENKMKEIASRKKSIYVHVFSGTRSIVLTYPHVAAQAGRGHQGQRRARVGAGISELFHRRSHEERLQRN